jgi:hypothetical protein
LAGLITNFHRDMAFQIAEVHAFREESGLPLIGWKEHNQRDAGLSGIKDDPPPEDVHHDDGKPSW